MFLFIKHEKFMYIFFFENDRKWISVLILYLIIQLCIYRYKTGYSVHSIWNTSLLISLHWKIICILLSKRMKLKKICFLKNTLSIIFINIAALIITRNNLEWSFSIKLWIVLTKWYICLRFLLIENNDIILK